jgi:putative membrane protein
MEDTVHTALALTAAAAVHPGGGFWWFLLIPLFWIAIVALFFALVGRRWRRWGGPYGHGPHPSGFPGWQGGGSSAESTLASRYANGDIDEKEYRARLEVLRSTGPVPPQRS